MGRGSSTTGCNARAGRPIRSPPRTRPRAGTACSASTRSPWEGGSLATTCTRCSPGSTVAPLDQTALYYLRSRGLSPETAAGMLTYGFAAEILGRMAHTELREELDRVVRARLADRSRGGRRA